MRFIFISCLLLCAVLSFCQKPIDVVESTFKVSGFGTETFHYGFAEGDQVVFNFEEVNGKELKEIEILEYSGPSKFMDYKTKKIIDKSITIPKTGIYSFRFANSALSGRVCRYKIQRIPASDNTSSFNSSVYWATLYDTTYTTQQQRYLAKRSYIPTTVVSTTDFFINGGRNATFQGGKSRITFPVSLPKNTVEWYYQFSASRDKEEIARTKQVFNLAGKLSKLIDETGTLSFGIDRITQPPGADYCDVYLLDFDNSRLFEAKTAYSHFPMGTRENIKSGVVRINKGIGSQPYIGIKNPDAGYGINIAIEVVAIVMEEQWEMREVKTPSISSRLVPYLK